MSISKEIVPLEGSRGLSQYEWKHIIEFLILHISQRPFRLNVIAKQLNLSLEKVVFAFSLLKDSFSLFHQIQKDKNVQELDIFSYSQQPEQLIKYELSAKEMQTYATFCYLQETLKKSTNGVGSNLKIRQLIEHHPLLFHTTTNGWKPSVSGKYFVSQYQKYQNLKKKCPAMEYKHISLAILY